ncbi:MPN527 family putative ECF transporter permease subunit [Mycoplasma sp. 1232]|uniref:MPN527 family putative ECF transporter permease subunit n=1 Tax=Mycoplasma sp. 1232 TaxID=3108527 RepID=UPI002B25A715|nr:hypothetical protein [Mycoplasma sp. 1232]MEA4333605.1 hypothetical protein [Mycoplasma sp. 1232]
MQKKQFLVWNNKNMNVIFKMAFTGLMLAISIVFSIIGSFIPFNSFLTFNFLLISAFLTAFIIDFQYSLIMLISNFLISPFITIKSTTLDIAFLGNFILLLMQAVFVFSSYLFGKLLWKSKLKKELSILVILAISSLVTIAIITFLNTFLFNLIYFKLFKQLDAVSLNELLANYDKKFKIFFFGIPNYFAGSIALYLSFNLINIAINYFIIYIFIFTLSKTKFLDNILNNFTVNKCDS